MPNADALKYDPYRKFKFLVKWNGNPLVAVHKVSGITKSVDPIDWRIGGDPNFSAKLPGLTKWEPITLERGLSANTQFQEWMDLVNKYQSAGLTSDEAKHNFRRDLTIEVYGLQSNLLMIIELKNAWPSKLTVADFDAKANEIAVEHIELQHEGWRIATNNTQSDERPTQA